MSHSSLEQLLELQRNAEDQITIGDQYYHYKSQEHTYTVIAVGLLEATQEPAVIYQNQEGIIWIRPITDFLGKVEVNGQNIDRFVKLD